MSCSRRSLDEDSLRCTRKFVSEPTVNGGGHQVVSEEARITEFCRFLGPALFGPKIANYSLTECGVFP
jgi:hypothetical protein